MEELFAALGLSDLTSIFTGGKNGDGSGATTDGSGMSGTGGPSWLDKSKNLAGGLIGADAAKDFAGLGANPTQPADKTAPAPAPSYLPQSVSTALPQSVTSQLPTALPSMTQLTGVQPYQNLYNTVNSSQPFFQAGVNAQGQMTPSAFSQALMLANQRPATNLGMPQLYRY